MLLSRAKVAKVAVAAVDTKKSEKERIPKLDSFLEKRDYAGAIALLNVRTHSFFFHMVLYLLSSCFHAVQEGDR